MADFATIPAALEESAPFTDEELKTVTEQHQKWRDHQDRLAAGDANAEDLDPPTKWTVTDERSLEWALRKFAEAAHQLRAKEELRVQWEDQVTRWWEKETAPLQRTLDFVEHHALAYLAQVRDDSIGPDGEPKIKSVSTPSGGVRSRGFDHEVIFDESDSKQTLLIEWLDRLVADEVVPPEVFKRSVSVSDIRQHVMLSEVESDGDVTLFGPDGVKIDPSDHGLAIRPPRVSLSVSVPGMKSDELKSLRK